MFQEILLCSKTADLVTGLDINKVNNSLESAI